MACDSVDLMQPGTTRSLRFQRTPEVLVLQAQRERTNGRKADFAEIFIRQGQCKLI